MRERSWRAFSTACLLSQMFAAMGGGKVLVGAERDDTGRIDVVVGDVVMPLDVVEVDGVGDAVGLDRKSVV